MSEATPETETRNPQTVQLDTLPTEALITLLANEAADAACAVTTASHSLANVADCMVQTIQRGGRVHYVGAGTSGRLGVLDAAEIPPTFGASPGLFCAHIAGGQAALWAAIEGAEDDENAGYTEIATCVKPGDAVLGISASGGAPYVLGAMRAARANGAHTIAMTSVADSPVAKAGEYAIILATGAEPLAGSTRMKAGAAQKIALATLSTAIMVRLGYVYENLMVSVLPTNAKLRKRAQHLVAHLADVDMPTASALLDAANASVKVAVLMHTFHLDATAAETLLETHHASLRKALAGKKNGP